jgi:hypothetical protein
LQAGNQNPVKVNMKISPRSILILAVLLLCGAMLTGAKPPAADAGETPNILPIPDQVYGLVLVNNTPVPAGTLVSAWCGGTKYAENATIDDPQYMYVLGIPGDDPDTNPAREGCLTGDTITFQIGGKIADQQKIWASGGSTQLDLSLNDLIPIFLPFVRK